MNPLDLRGPEFLLFYTLFSGLVIALAAAVRRVRESRATSIEPPRKVIFDIEGRAGATHPYMIACLRGGKNELVRVAAVSLVDRGLLESTEDGLVTTNLGR